MHVSALVLIAASAAAAAAAAASATPRLVVYTYDGILQVNGTYDFGADFAAYAGLEANEVQVEFFDDANGILQAAIAPPAGKPLPDVLLGLDNVLQLDAAESLLLPYSSPLLSTIRSDVREALELPNTAPMTPFDFSQIVVTAHLDLLKSNYSAAYALITSPSFSLQTYIDNAATLFPLTILQDPLKSGTGLNFLMWTIAVFGDRTLGLVGSRGAGSDWRNFWRLANQYNAPVYGSWSDSFYGPFTDNQYPLIISYSTDVDYPVCFGEPDRYGVYGSLDDGVRKAWENIEAVAIMKRVANDTDRLTLAKQFVDWMLTEPVQESLPLRNFVFPARVNITLPDCYNASEQLDLKSVNTYLNAPTVQLHLDQWLAEVDFILNGTPTPTPTATPTSAATDATVGARGGGLIALVVAGAAVLAWCVLGA